MSLSRILNDDPQGQRHYRNGGHPYPASDPQHPYYDHGPPRHHHHHPPAQQQEYAQHEYWDRNGHYDDYREPTHHPHAPVYRSPSPAQAQHYSSEHHHHHHHQPSHHNHHHTHSHTRHARASSSDLEDCHEIWSQAVSEYALLWRERERALEAQFDERTRDRNDETARALAHRYADKIAAVEQRNAYPAYASPDVAYRGRAIDDLSSRGRGGYKRPHNESDAGAGDYPVKSASAKRRRLDEESIANGGDDDELLYDDSGAVAPEPKRRGRKPKLGNFQVPGGTPSDVDAASTRSTTPRKGRGGAPGKRGGAPYTTAPVVANNIDSLPGTGTATPSGRFLDNGEQDSYFGSGSMPASPASGALVFEMDEMIPPLPKGVNLEGEALMERLKLLEAAQHKVWLQIARKDVPKAYKYYAQGQSMKMHHHKRIGRLCYDVARKQSSRPLKAAKENQARAKKVVREMMLFWRKNDKDERDGRKRAEREAFERARQEEEQREQARQKRKLEFLISQTELYSHFVGSKLLTEAAGGAANGVDGASVPAALNVLGDDLGATDDGRDLKDIDFDDADERNLHLHAKKNAQLAILRARQRVVAFDAKGKQNGDANVPAGGMDDDDDEGEGVAQAEPPLMTALDESEELNFVNPTLPEGHTNVPQPKMLMTELKEYQLKGLNWLVGLYEQGINGILADEMGLGKTVQSIALLSYLAETHNIWGPFLVIAPSSTLHNWQQEITRFVPKLKALPYWGGVKDRQILRKFWNKSHISYSEDAQFHVLVSSYPLVLQDQQYFKLVNWQYMILDEAQAIKNAASARWNTLLDFNCRNRLLLTGTPIQNSMQELWALLHFIMPTLFDSLAEFSTWFTKDENDVKGGGSGINANQLRRLHMILKPFMLRRLKSQVQNELSEKIEIDVLCELSPRQRKMYRRLRANVSVTELLQRANSLGDADSAKALMNLVMQFRKVCNHPELFERAEVSSSFSMSHWARSGNLAREGDWLMFPYSARNPIEVNIPELFYKDGGLLDVPGEDVRIGYDTRWLDNLMNIWSPDWIQRSLCEHNSTFSFLRLQDISAAEAHDIFTTAPLRRILLGLEQERRLREDGAIYLDPEFIASTAAPFAQLPSSPLNPFLEVADGLPALNDISDVAWQATCLSRPAMRWYSDIVLAPPIEMYVPDRTFVERQARIMDSPSESLAFYGLPSWLRDDPDAFAQYEKLYPGAPPVGLFGASSANQLPWSTTQVPEAKRLINDSGKLARLDLLLQELKAGGHRVLIYFQMTRMIDLMEEYLVFRQYKYLRLDGSSKLEDRRDMVNDWQTRSDLFIFLLSTRAGGLGINLTAADTVVFYDHDWNPSNDAQAMDRAHRLGQTRQVTVYRLITKGTIDERIVQLARVKKEVQDAVVGNKQVSEAAKPTEIAQLLLNDDELANFNDVSEPNGANGDTAKRKGKAADRGPAPAVTSWSSLRDAWVDEGDDFFGHSSVPNNANEATLDEDLTQPPAPSSGRGKRGRGRGSRARGERGTRSRGRRGMGKRGSGVGGDS